MTMRITALAAVILFAAGCQMTMYGQPAPVQYTQVTPSRWPAEAALPDGPQVTIFQPQLEAFDGNQMWSRAAVSVAMPGAAEPTFGAVWLKSRVTTDRVARTVRIMDVTVTGSTFPDGGAVTPQALSTAAQNAVFSQPIVLSLDNLLASLQVVQQKEAGAAQLQVDAPRIIFLQHPAIKVQYDGAPKLMQAQNSSLLTVVNTPFFVALDPVSRTYFLKGAGRWFGAPDPMGPFQAVRTVPRTVFDLANQMGYQDPQQPITDAQFANLQIITATEPTELIWTDGPPQLATIPGTNLLYFANTDSDVFVDIGSQRTFVLLSGRWFVAPTPNGPWAFVSPDQLPADFARIPADGPKGDVLACVAGTPQAADAIADTFIPQTAAVDRHQFDQPPVEYDGSPNFAAIAGTSCSYAVNTPQCVILQNNVYYCCDNAVWYTAWEPNGPWQLCTRVPVEIYSIPPSCPIYPCTFCFVYGSTDDVLYCGYTPGYVGCYPFHGVVFFGTGYHYTPWVGGRYYDRPHTFGFAAHYNSYQNHWGFSFGLGAAGGGGSEWVGKNPRFAGHSGEWFGFGGYRPTFGRAEVQGNGPAPKIDRGAKDVYARNVYEGRKDLHQDVPGVNKFQPKQPTRNDQPRNAQPAPGPPNNVYADPQGNVYRKTDNGWDVRDPKQNQWKPGQQDAPKPPQAQQQPEPRRQEPTPPPQQENPQPPKADQPVAHQRGEAPPPRDQKPTEGQRSDPTPSKPEPTPPPQRSEPAPSKPEPTPPPQRSEPAPSKPQPTPPPQRSEPAPPQKQEPAPSKPAPPAEKPKAPNGPYDGLNKDDHARQVGNQRGEQNPKSGGGQQKK